MTVVLPRDELTQTIIHSTLSKRELQFVEKLRGRVKLVKYIRGRVTVTSSGGTEEMGAGYCYITDVTAQDPGDSVTPTGYQDPPNNTVLQSCRASSLNLTFSIIASYPIVTIDGTDYTLNRAVGESHFSRNIDLTLSGDGNIVAQVKTPDDIGGAQDTIAITLTTAPTITSLSFIGGYPGSQVELKVGDTFQLTGTTDVDSNAIEIIDFGSDSALVSDLEIIVLGTNFMITGTVANRGTSVQSLAARCRARNADLAFGPTRDTNTGGGSINGTDLINLNNLHPTNDFGTPNYPGGQGALKGNEQATITVTVSNYDSYVVDSPNSDLTIVNDNPPALIVERLGGTYNVSTTNLRATAIRNANNAVTTELGIVRIAAVGTQVSIIESANRLRSGGNDGTSPQNHSITVSANQLLLNTPSLAPDSGGSRGIFVGSWSGSGASWARSLQIHDNDEKGNFNWESLIATNLAGIVTNTITGDGQYVLGGFVQRNLTFGAFLQTTSLGVAVVDYSKIVAGIFTATANSAVRHNPQGDHGDAADEYTIDSPLGINPQTLFWNDQTAASNNSTGTAQITNVEELV